MEKDKDAKIILKFWNQNKILDYPLRPIIGFFFFLFLLKGLNINIHSKRKI